MYAVAHANADFRLCKNDSSTDHFLIAPSQLFVTNSCAIFVSFAKLWKDGNSTAK
jgi:hypothetical protein